MALNIVTGKGPRVGSSFVMQQCKVNGLHVNGDKFLRGFLPLEGNPLGYYDMFPWDVALLQHGVAKVWPLSLSAIPVPVTNIVILERKNIDKQIESCLKQIDREPIKLDASPEELIRISSYTLHKWLGINNKVNHYTYYTEDLDSNIDEIVNILGD